MGERRLDRSAISGQWLHVNSANDSTTTPNDQLLVLTCQDFGAPLTIDRLAFETTVAGDTTSVARIGVWADDGTNNRPGALIHDSGEIDTTAAPGILTATVSLTIGPGRVWFGVVSQGAPTTDPTYVTTIDNENPIGMADPISGLNQFFLSQSGVSGALPDPPVPSGTTGVSIAVAVRVA